MQGRRARSARYAGCANVVCFDLDQVVLARNLPEYGLRAGDIGTVDIYDPLTGETEHARGADVAAWFLDTDHDGMTFHICQAFFPGDADAWDKLQRALKAQIDPEAFEQMRGPHSFLFQPGKYNRIAVKVIDFRGNEAVRVMPLGSIRYEQVRR